MPYPIVPNNEEKKQIDEWLSIIRKENEPHAREAWPFWYRRIASPSRTGFSPKDFLWGKEDWVFGPLKDHIIKAVLLVAMRFNWPPEEILALWQIEGLRHWIDFEQENVSGLRSIFCDLGLEPNTPEEARAFARSIVLFKRWGLDILVPHKRVRFKDPKTGKWIYDNQIKNAPNIRQKEHDEHFKAGFAEEIAPIISESPLDYLMSESEKGPIIIPKAGRKLLGHYEYRTHSEYQTTILAMQYARFKYLESVIQRDYGEFTVRGVKVELKPPFPALVRTFYNCRQLPAREALINAVKDTVDRYLKKTPRSQRPKKLKAREVEGLFRVLPVPQRIRNAWKKREGYARCYLGGLRFEVLRLTYESLLKRW